MEFFFFHLHLTLSFSLFYSKVQPLTSLFWEKSEHCLRKLEDKACSFMGLVCVLVVGYVWVIHLRNDLIQWNHCHLLDWLSSWEAQNPVPNRDCIFDWLMAVKGHDFSVIPITILLPCDLYVSWNKWSPFTILFILIGRVSCFEQKNIGRYDSCRDLKKHLPISASPFVPLPFYKNMPGQNWDKLNRAECP